MISGKDFIEYFLFRLGKLGQKQLQKIAYLTEIEYMKRHGERLSDLEFIKYYYGPYSEDIPAIENEDENIRTKEESNAFYLYKISELKNNLEFNIPDYLKKEIDEIIKKFKNKTGSELEQLAKNTEAYIDAEILREKIDLDEYAEYYKALLSEKFWENVDKTDEENIKNKVYGKKIIKDVSELKSIFS